MLITSCIRCIDIGKNFIDRLHPNFITLISFVFPLFSIETDLVELANIDAYNHIAIPTNTNLFIC